MAASQTWRVLQRTLEIAARFFKRGRGIGVRGKIGIDPMGNPAFPAPFSFANNEAKGRFRVSMVLPDRGRCTTGLVTWRASR